jgi:hypothetical protein
MTPDVGALPPRRGIPGRRIHGLHPQQGVHSMGIDSRRFITLGVVLASGGLATAQQFGSDPALQNQGPLPFARQPSLIVPEQPRIALDTEGNAFVMPVQHVWKPLCNTALGAVTVADLANMDRTHKEAFADPDQVIVIDNSRELNGFNIVYVIGANVPAAALPAFTAAEAYIESQFSDPITITVTVSFAALGPGILGGTSSSYGSVTYAGSRAGLINNDANDTIQDFLPNTTTVPVRYSTGTTTNETRVFWTIANYNATAGSVAGNAASMQYSTNFTWDYDPSNGVAANAYSFRDVIIHETGHAMGFTSGVDFRVNDIEVLDLFRFRRTDSTAASDFNPDTTAEFTARPRWAVFNNPNDDVNSDLISAEYRMSDGSPQQASHFRDQTPAIGIMDPTLGFGQTFFPDYFRAPDLAMFDAIGYDR